MGIQVDDDQIIYIADPDKHRILQFNYDTKTLRVVAGGNGHGYRMDQLNRPCDVILDRNNDSIIICDVGNRRVVRWPRRNGTQPQTIISDIDCSRLAMDKNGDLYVSDYKKNEVRRWRIGENKGKLVAGGNRQGNRLNQLNSPTFPYVDEDQSVYVSDLNNHRVIKWMRDTREGVVVAGGEGQGNSLTQLSFPRGVIVDNSGNVYVADSKNDRIMRWSKGSRKGSVVVGGNGEGRQSSQLRCRVGLSFDQEGNLFVTDCDNDRVQKFDIDRH